MKGFSEFRSPAGGSDAFFSVQSVSGVTFAAEAEALLAEYENALAERGYSRETEVLLRFHLSDPANRETELRQILGTRKSFISIVGQTPVDGRIALEAWHFKGENSMLEFFGKAEKEGQGSYAETAAEFTALKRHLGSPLPGTVMRTWLYCRDVDNNYAGLVRGRNDFFAAEGMDQRTGYLASTGIGGTSADPTRLVKMDTLYCRDLAPGQIEHLSAPEHLSPTTLYNVTFERASRVIYGDRSRIYVSGTASIDRNGKVVHVGDPAAQAERMMENLFALLRAGNAEPGDLRAATLYLRDPHDAPSVMAKIAPLLPAGLPLVVLTAPVCRPAWLVEIEAVAVNGKGQADFPVPR